MLLLVLVSWLSEIYIVICTLGRNKAGQVVEYGVHVYYHAHAGPNVTSKFIRKDKCERRYPVCVLDMKHQSAGLSAGASSSA